METEACWTLDELVRRAGAALADREYPGAPNGRVRDLPDGRVVRWYATIGLVDRPGGTRGRSALYGPRHLLQLVAVKRRQAEGRALADIQAELTGATDATLRRIARVPADLLSRADVSSGEPAPQRGRFWTDRPAPPAAAPPAADTVTTFAGIPLATGAMLLLSTQPGTDELPDIHAAARPLLELLAARGLLTPTDRSRT